MSSGRPWLGMLVGWMWILTGVLLTGCQVDDLGPARPGLATVECVDLPPLPGMALEWQVLQPQGWYEGLALGPVRSGEVVVSHVDARSGNDTTFILNVRSGARRVLLPGGSTPLAWLGDWIYLLSSEGFFKLQSNGDSLRALDLPADGSRPVLNPAGDRVAVFVATPATAAGYCVADLQGHILDRIPQIGACDWFAPDSILGYGLMSGTQQYSIRLLQVSTHQVTEVMAVPMGVRDSWNGVLQMRMFADHDRAAVLTGNGLWVISTRSKWVRQLAESCDNHRIGSIRVDPYDRFVYAEEHAFVQVDSVTLRHAVRTVVLDVETGERVDTLF